MRWTLTRPSVADRGLVGLVALLCAFLTVGATGASLWLRTTADDLATQTFAEATYAATQVRVTYDEVRLGDVPGDAGAEVAAALPPAVRAAVEAPRPVVTSPEMVPNALPDRPGVPSFLTVVGLSGLDSLVRVEGGRLPDPGVSLVDLADLPTRASEPYLRSIGFSLTDRFAPKTVEVIEVTLETTAAAEMNIPVGSLVALTGRSYGAIRTSLLRVVGTYVAADPTPSALDDADTARLPAIDPTPDAKTVRASALAADPNTVLRGTWQRPPDLRYTFDPATSSRAANVQELVAQGREVELQSWPPIGRALDATAETGLGDLAAEVTAQRETSDAMALLGLTALAAGGFAVLLAAAVVLTGRRRAPTTVVRARGATLPWLLRQRGGEALLLAGPGLAVACGVVAAAGGAWPDLLVALGTTLLCIGLVAGAQLAGTGRESTVLQLVVRDAVQLALVVLAVAATWLVLRRGGLIASDPITLLIAPLLGAAAAVVVLRLLQLLLRALRLLGAGTSRLTPVVSVSQALAISRQVVVATAAVVLALSAAGVAVTLNDSLRHGAEQGGWERVGSDLVVQAVGLEDDTAAAVAALPGVESTSPVFTSPSVSINTALGVEGVRLVAFDAADMRAVGAGSPLQVDLPQGSGDALSILVSPDLEFDEALTDLRYATTTVPVQVRGTLERIPGVTTGESFVAVDAAALAAVSERNLTAYDVILISGTPDPAEVERVVRERSPQATTLVRSAVVEEQLSSPVVTRTTALLLAVLVGAVAVAAFAVVLLVSLGGPVRRRTSELLLALGADDRQARRVSALGVVPLVAAACLAALGCGALLVIVADSGLDVASLTDTLAPVPILPSTGSVAFAPAVCAALVLLAGVAAARPSRQPDQPARPGAERR